MPRKGDTTEEKIRDIPGVCSALPGTAERIAALAERAAKRCELFTATDASLEDDRFGLKIKSARNGRQIVVGSAREVAERQLYLTTVKLPKFSERLHFLRRRRGLKMSQLPEKSGLTLPAIFYLETGKREPTLQSALALARALDVPLGVLAGESPDS